jgi:hypothetical protein
VAIPPAPIGASSSYQPTRSGKRVTARNYITHPWRPAERRATLSKRVLGPRPTVAAFALLSGWVGATACLGIADTTSTASDAGGDAPHTLDGGGFPGTDSGSGGSGGTTAIDGSAGATSGGAPGGGGAPSGGGGSSGTGGTTGGTLTIMPPLALSGDGFLAKPDLCGQVVWDSYQQPSYKAIHAGRDVPCGSIATYRAFMRFDLSPASGKTIKSAHLRFYYVEKIDNPTVAVNLFRVSDFGQLDSNDWNATEVEAYGAVLGSSTAPGWIDVDVTAGANAAAGAGGFLAFKLQAADEGFDPGGKSHWYGFAATESGQSTSPRVVITY